jgi:hypothetical protein
MLNDHPLAADSYREIARELRHTAFTQMEFDLCRHDQLLALAKGFDRFADRIDGEVEKLAAD